MLAGTDGFPYLCDTQAGKLYHAVQDRMGQLQCKLLFSHEGGYIPRYEKNLFEPLILEAGGAVYSVQQDRIVLCSLDVDQWKKSNGEAANAGSKEEILVAALQQASLSSSGVMVCEASTGKVYQVSPGGQHGRSSVEWKTVFTSAEGWLTGMQRNARTGVINLTMPDALGVTYQIKNGRVELVSVDISKFKNWMEGNQDQHSEKTDIPVVIQRALVQQALVPVAGQYAKEGVLMHGFSDENEMWNVPPELLPTLEPEQAILVNHQNLLQAMNTPLASGMLSFQKEGEAAGKLTSIHLYGTQGHGTNGALQRLSH